MKLSRQKLRKLILQEVKNMMQESQVAIGLPHIVPNDESGDQMLIDKAREFGRMMQSGEFSQFNLPPGAELLQRMLSNRMMKIGATSDPARQLYGYDQTPSLDRIARLKQATYLLNPDAEFRAGRKEHRKQQAMSGGRRDRMSRADMMQRYGYTE